MPSTGPFAHLRTSDVLLRAAELLRASGLTIDHQMAAELEVRARWLKVARHDTGVTQERRLAIAAVEDLSGADPDAQDRVEVLNVEVYGGWLVRLWRRTDSTSPQFDAALFRPGGGREVFTLFRELSQARALHSVAEHLAREIPVPAREIGEGLASLLDSPSS